MALEVEEILAVHGTDIGDLVIAQPDAAATEAVEVVEV